MNEDQEETILKHYITVNRYGDKGIVPEVIDPNSPTAKLLRRIEEKRLGADCKQAIDLRGKVPGKVEQHKHQGMTHYLDKKAKKIFQETCDKHGGRFTVEAFENVTQADHTFKAQQQKERKAQLEQKRAEDQQRQAQKGQQACQTEQEDPEARVTDPEEGQKRHFLGRDQLTRFGNVCVRSEPRMTYLTKVFVLRPGGEPLFAKTVDISTHGVQISCDDLDEDFHAGEELIVHFDALEKEFKEKVLKSKYVVKQVECTDAKILMKLARIPANDDRAFVNFFDSFIEKHKRRYKTDCQDLVERLTSRIFEHSFFLNTSAIPLMLSAERQQTPALACITNDINKDFVHDLSASLTVNAVSIDSLSRFVLQLKKKKALSACAWHVTVFSFISTRDKESYIAASSDFGDDRELNNFIRLGMANNKFRAYHCQVSETRSKSKEDGLTILKNMPGYQDLSCKSAESFLTDMSHIMLVYDITDSVSTVSFPEQALNEENVARNFSHFKSKPVEHTDIEVLSVRFKRGRAEPRYLHETEASVIAKNKKLSGNMRDFSIKGMCIELDSPCYLNDGVEVEVTLPAFAKITKDKRLKKMMYEVIGLNEKKDVLYLHRASDKHSGSDFFKALIDKNKDKLTVCNREDELVFKTRIGQIMVAYNLPGVPVFVGRGDKVAFEVKCLGYSNNMSHIDQIFKMDGEVFDIPFLTNTSQFRRLIKNQKRAEDVGKIFSTDAYLLKSPDDKLYCKLAREIEEGNQFETTMNMAKQAKIFCTYHIILNKAVKINKLDFEEEMSQIRVRSLAKHKQLSEYMDNIHVVGELIDITGALAHQF